MEKDSVELRTYKLKIEIPKNIEYGKRQCRVKNIFIKEKKSILDQNWGSA